MILILTGSVGLPVKGRDMRDQQQAVLLVASAVGFASLTLLWLGLVLGVVLRDGWALERIRPATLAAVHQTVTACGLTLAVTHALTQLAIPDGPTRLIDELIPFVDRRSPFGVGMGVLGIYLLIAVASSVLLRRRLGYHRWRVIHRVGYLGFAVILCHVVTVDPGRQSMWLLAPLVLLGAVTIVVGLGTAGWVTRLPLRISDLLKIGRRKQRVTIHVDATRCVHFGFCQHEAPDVFQVRDDGRLEHSPMADGDTVDAVIRAARACPTRAILLSRHAGRVVLADPPEEMADPPGDGDTKSGDTENRADPDGTGGTHGTSSTGGRSEHASA
jgi:ferredoxin/DMSO/TMAO reductase YedYZ heme-binding membrane subunit